MTHAERELLIFLAECLLSDWDDWDVIPRATRRQQLIEILQRCDAALREAGDGGPTR